MSKKYKGQSEQHRRKAKKKAKKTAVPFVRPREWAQAELVGVLGWIERLEAPLGESYPPDWRAGQLRHYRKRAKQLRSEIRRHAKEAKDA